MVRLYKRGKIWYLRWSENGKIRKQSTKTTRKEVAEEIRRKREEELLLGRTIKRPMSVNELLEAF
ncbi:MAG TPA: hypothetical protein ENN07_07825, partial [candidate division Zixibacteria bacterium]|nr:hypothetical protein [candidate division Zixibacteria bacterium]